jgi:hydrogenase expression/formation protein HypD
MKYIQEFRQDHLVQEAVRKIAKAVDRNRYYQFMEYCGGHTYAIYHYGILDLLPKNIGLVHGPGCPVCVLPIARLDKAIFLAQLPDVIFCSYGDMLRVPGSFGINLLKVKACGADVRMIYSVDDAINIAEANSNKNIIFFAIGFETTTPSTAVAIKKVFQKNLKNFYVYCNHLLTPQALNCLLQMGGVHLDGFIGPGHVSTVIGSRAYETVSRIYKKPVVISGFEPLDIMQSILMLVCQVNINRFEVENQYTRVVTNEGNLKSQSMMNEVFKVSEAFEWRGLGFIPKSSLQLKDCYQQFDAEKKFEIPEFVSQENSGCECADILRGLKKPRDCKLFGTVCTPENPMGACMVSSEGACAAAIVRARKMDDR